MTDCRNYVECADCSSHDILASFIVTKNLPDGKYVSSYFKYVCKKCKKTWKVNWKK